MSYCPHPHVWELNGHAQCSVCYEIVACPVQLECNHLRAQLHDLQQRTNAHAKSWEALVESERKRGAVDAAAKERDTRAEKEGLLAQLEQARAQGGEASRRAASGEKELATCSNQLACIREGAKTLSAERDRLRATAAALRAERDRLRAAAGEKRRKGGGECERCRALTEQNRQYEAGMRAIAYGMGVFVPMLTVLLAAVWNRRDTLLA